MQDLHTFGCPVFALESQLASGKAIPKWAPRCRLGLNLGPSPHHARNVNLVLNLTNGLVSPQYHCRYDDFFETTRLNQADLEVPVSWRVRAGFVKYDGGNLTEPHNNSIQKNFVISVDDKKGLDDHSSDGPDDLVQDIDMTPPGKAALPSHVPCLISEQAPITENEGSTEGDNGLCLGPWQSLYCSDIFMAIATCTTWQARVLQQVKNLGKRHTTTGILDFKSECATQLHFTLR